MARVKYPFIIRYPADVKGVVRFAREPDEKVKHFDRVDDQLMATVYTNYKQFSKGFNESASSFVKRNELLGENAAELIYVGE